MENTEKELTATQLVEMGRQAGDQLRQQIGAQKSVVEHPYALSAMFKDPSGDSESFLTFELEQTLGALLARHLDKKEAQYVALYEKLVANGFTHEGNQLEYRNDGYAWAIEERVFMDDSSKDFMLKMFPDSEYTPRKLVSRAIVFTTQSQNFLLVLHSSGGRWQMHFRQFWTELPDHEEELGYYPLQEYAEEPVTLDVALSFSSEMVEHYSDDTPQTSYPQRPSLNTFLKGNLVPKKEGSGIGLRYGDLRDNGYILSYAPFGFGERDHPETVERAGSVALSTVNHVLDRLDEVSYVLNGNFD